MCSRLSSGPAPLPDWGSEAPSSAPVDYRPRFQLVDPKGATADPKPIPWSDDHAPESTPTVYYASVPGPDMPASPRFVRERGFPGEWEIGGRLFKTGDAVAATIMVDSRPVAVTGRLSIIEFPGENPSAPERRGYITNATDLQGELVSASLPVDASTLSKLE